MRRLSIHIAIILSSLLLTYVCSAQQTSDNKQAESGQNASPVTRKSGGKASFPDALKGTLALANGMSINGPGVASLWIKSDGAQYEIVFTVKTKVPPDWRQVNYVGHDVLGVPGLPLYIAREKNTTQEVGYGPNGEVMMLFPVAGRYSVRGNITLRPQGGHPGRITAGEVRELAD